MKFDDGIPAIPLWIDGHAWFSVFEEFIDIRETDGEVHYRVPKCGPGEVAVAVISARQAQPAWHGDVAGRQRLLKELASLLDQFGGDFAKLLARETGADSAAARDEVARAVSVLQQAAAATDSAAVAGVQAVVSEAAEPLASVAAGLARALAAGDTAIVLSDARAPSAVFALAELSARAGFPAGTFCLLHGDLQARVALKAALQG